MHKCAAFVQPLPRSSNLQLAFAGELVTCFIELGLQELTIARRPPALFIPCILLESGGAGGIHLKLGPQYKVSGNPDKGHKLCPLIKSD